MKSILVINVLLLTALWGWAQEYRAPVSAQTIRLVLQHCEASVEGYDGSELVVNARDYEAPPARAEGLRPLYSSGTDNSGIGLSINEDGDEITVTRVGRGDAHYEFRVPRAMAVIVEEVNYSGDDLLLRNLSGEIEVRTTSSDVRMEDVTGPVVANSVSGNVDMVFQNVNQQKPSAITLVSGDVDITLPAQTGANLELASVSGEVYTDFDISLTNGDPDREGLRRIGMNRPIEGTINNGGVDIRVKTVSGDIYLRKSQ